MKIRQDKGSHDIDYDKGQGEDEGRNQDCDKAKDNAKDNMSS